jgi:hypothetical protein
LIKLIMTERKIRVIEQRDDVAELLKGFVDDPKEFFVKVKQLHEVAGGLLMIQHREKVMLERLPMRSEAEGELREQGLDQYLMQREGYSWNGIPHREEGFSAKRLARTKDGERKCVRMVQSGQLRYDDPPLVAVIYAETFKWEDSLNVVLWSDGRESLLWSANGETALSRNGLCAVFFNLVVEAAKELMQEEHQ